MSDDFIVEEESSNRTFLYVAGGLAAVMLIGIIAIVVLALTGANGENSEVAVMNQTIEYQNSLVTQTVAAMTLEASRPTNTPLPPTYTPTAIPTFTPAPPTNTPTAVAQTPVPETPEGGGEAAPVETATPEPTPTLGPGGGQLPPGGLGMWGAVTAAALLVGVIVIVRRLRPAV
jgi:hypothetical protein